MLILLCSCKNTVQEIENCSKYEDEKYFKTKIDDSLVKEALEYHKILLNRFDESSVKEINHEAYHLQFYSSHGYGQSVKFEKKNNNFSITVKCKSKVEWAEDWAKDCKEYKIRIEENAWNEIEKMIYEFDFWTEEEFREGNDALDGYGFFIEGNRPEAKKCNKKSYNIIGRSSPRYDKMEALFNNIREFENSINNRYEHLIKIQ